MMTCKRSGQVVVLMLAAVELMLVDAGYAGEGGKPGAVAKVTRTMLLAPVSAEPSWRDLAFLAAVPAATVANAGSPSLVALDETGLVSPEIQDYARRYRPERVYSLGGTNEHLVVSGHVSTRLPAGSADEAACALCRTFWQKNPVVVICPEEDYEAGLVASALAARLRAPLLFSSPKGLSSTVTQELLRLQVRDLLVIGNRHGQPPIRFGSAKVTELAGTGAVLAWTRKQALPVRYLAAVNPTDRSRAIIRKLSLAGALLAAGRSGLVVPLTYETHWKTPFTGTELKGDLPADLPKSEVPPKMGTIACDGHEYKFLLTGKPKERDLRLYVDLTGSGKFTDKGNGPFVSGDAIELGGKQYAVTLGAGNGVGKADVRLSWPRAEQLCGDLRGFYETLGSAPEYLCLVGFPDTIPQTVVGHGGIVDEMNSDTPFANADSDPFAEIGVARVIAENVSFATLFASRVLTYPALLDPAWQDQACQARWENTFGKLFENVGFKAPYRHTIQDLKWIVPPVDGKGGKRAASFDQESPLTRCTLLAHEDHSWWRELGHTFAWDAEVLLSPVVVESGGCLTAVMDREPDDRSVIARLFRKGAAAFVGNGRPGCAAQELQRLEFWNGVLAGQTIGQAHRRSINSAWVMMNDTQQLTGGSLRYQFYIRTLFGDPAFAPHLPGSPRLAPAHMTMAGETVTVHGPAQWWPVKISVPEDWKKWVEKDLYVIRGAGSYALRGWCGEGYDREETYVTAEFTTRRRVSKIEQIQKPPAPLGWREKFYVDENADGSRTYRWSVRLVDFDQMTGKILNAVDRLDYRVSYE